MTISKNDECYSASSILEVLSANLDCGCRITLEAVGPDEQEALDRLVQLLHEFHEQEKQEARERQSK